MNRTFKYLLNNKMQNAGVMIVFTLIMIIQLLLTSELWFSFFPSGKKALSQACYDFEVEDIDENNLALIVSDYPKAMIRPLDVQLAGTGYQDHWELISEHIFDKNNPDYISLLQDTDVSSTQIVRIYAAITDLSEKRINDIGSYSPSKPGDDSIVLLPVRNGEFRINRSGFDVGKYLYILGNSLKIVGVADIYEVNREEYASSLEYIANINTVLRLTSKHEIIFQFERPLNDEEQTGLINFMSERFTVTRVNEPYILEQNQIKSLKRLTVVAILCIILCFWLTIEFIWYLLECRQKEFRVYQICGATGKYIVKLILIHISILCFVSEFIGWAIFIILQKHTGLVQLDSVPWPFALINLLSFWIIAITVVSVNLALEATQKRKLGISRTAR